MADIIEEFEPREQAEMLEAIEDDRVPDVVGKMEPDDAADMLQELTPEETADILDHMEEDEADRPARADGARARFGGRHHDQRVRGASRPR